MPHKWQNKDKQILKHKKENKWSERAHWRNNDKTKTTAIKTKKNENGKQHGNKKKTNKRQPQRETNRQNDKNKTIKRQTIQTW